MARIPGDELLAIKLRTVETQMTLALEKLSANQYINCAVHICRAQMIFNDALSDLERLTQVPWTAIPDQPDIEKEITP